MASGRERGRGPRYLRWLAIVVAVGSSWAVAALLFAGAAGAAGSDDGPPVTEIVPVRIHGHDSSWPPVLVFSAVVVVGGAIVVAFVFLRRAREALRTGGTPPTGG